MKYWVTPSTLKTWSINPMQAKTLTGLENLAPEHVKHYGPIFGFAKFTTAFVKLREFQHISSRVWSFWFWKARVITLCSQKSYCGITLTSVLANVFEILSFKPHESNLWWGQNSTTNPNRKGLDVWTLSLQGRKQSQGTLQKVIAYTHVSMILPVLFDTVEFCVLFEQLSHSGVKRVMLG